MDASSGHEIVSRVIKDDHTPYKMLVGDQNAQRSSMQNTYGNSARDLLSVGTADPLTHVVVDKGLNATKLDLGKDGSDFNNKGVIGCSDHSPIAITITLTKK
jgi:hypothetical protein